MFVNSDLLLFLWLAPSSGVVTWSSMVLRHRLLSSAIFLSSPAMFMCLFTASIHLVRHLSFHSRHVHVFVHSIHPPCPPSFFPVPPCSCVCSQHPSTLSAIFLSSPAMFMCLFTASIHLVRHLSFQSRHVHVFVHSIHPPCPPSFFPVPPCSCVCSQHPSTLSAIFLSSPAMFMCLFTASIHLVLGIRLPFVPAGFMSVICP